MNKKPVFTGVATALVTPTCEQGVDYAHLAKLIDFQIDAGVAALVVCATTGEAPTLQDDEHLETLAFAVQRAAGRIPVIAGTGSNDTAHAVMMTRRACELGVDAILAVTPYYNKPPQSGLIRSFYTIADASQKPVIVYNVPSRTSVNIEPATYAALAKHPMIYGIKEANGNIAQIVETFSLVGGELSIYSGNDDQIVPILSMGGKGVISVLSNVAPRQAVQMCRKYFEGDTAGAAGLQCELLPLVKALFSQTNPIPVKAALARMGLCQDHLRLPLIPMEEPYRGRLYAVMDQLGL